MFHYFIHVDKILKNLEKISATTEKLSTLGPQLYWPTVIELLAPGVYLEMR